MINIDTCLSHGQYDKGFEAKLALEATTQPSYALLVSGLASLLVCLIGIIDIYVRRGVATILSVIRYQHVCCSVTPAVRVPRQVMVPKHSLAVL